MLELVQKLRLPANVLLGITLLSTIVLPMNCYADSFSFSGYVKSYALAQDSISIQSDAIDKSLIGSITTENITIENNSIQNQAQSIAGNFQSQNAQAKAILK